MEKMEAGFLAELVRIADRLGILTPQQPPLLKYKSLYQSLIEIISRGQ
jgi:hypothetical protein